MIHLSVQVPGQRRQRWSRRRESFALPPNGPSCTRGTSPFRQTTSPVAPTSTCAATRLLQSFFVFVIGSPHCGQWARNSVLA